MTKFELETGRKRVPRRSWEELVESGSAKVFARREAAAARAAEAAAAREPKGVPRSWRFYPGQARPCAVSTLEDGTEVEAPERVRVISRESAARYAQIMGRCLVSVVPIRPRGRKAKRIT